MTDTPSWAVPVRAAIREGRWSEAARQCQDLLARNPDETDAWFVLGMLHERQKQYPQALACFQHVLERLEPRSAEAWYQLGRIHLRLQDHARAARCLEEAVRLQPDFVEAYTFLGQALYNLLRLEDAARAFERALQGRPDFDNPRRHLEPGRPNTTYRSFLYSELGRVQRKLGWLQAAQASYRQALRIDPGNVVAHSRLLFLLGFHVLGTPRTLLAAHRAWDRIHGAQGRAHAHRHSPNRFAADSASGPLRIGYLSPDFHGHAVSYFLEPILAHHEPERVEVFCYALQPRSDAVTRRLQGYGHHWRPVSGRSARDIARLVYEDRVQVLVDLAGHTSTALQAFTYRPAPVQATYLGYFCTTGLAAMDYWITDGTLHPPESVERSTETPWRLERCCLAYRPADEAPPVEPPSLEAGVVFCSFNQIIKISDRAIELWAEILRKAPGSRLLIKCQLLREPAIRRRLVAKFAACGIPEGRLELHTFTPDYRRHLALYNRAHIALDSLPRTGGSTTADALWMGVPVITLAGPRFVQRLSATMLEAVGLAELIAGTETEYVRKAVELAADPWRLQALREGLRSRMQASSLCDGAGLARALEEAYAGMWRRWKAQSE